ncbi:hypothetical protein HGRIS_007352 [Hohenbuehelia grisea]|uniref:Dihydrolipoamide acetyltransferase component of pyruvate dehydrogenase complex n=1 Tax=Hohenbuehelia grisea TaxID=104357 RepID=A0ABR3J5Y3_9AGAR
MRVGVFAIKLGLADYGNGNVQGHRRQVQARTNSPDLVARASYLDEDILDVFFSIHHLAMYLRPLRRLLGRPRVVSQFHTSSPLWGRKVVHQFKLADIGEGITECEVIKWSVKPLGKIQSFDPLCEVQSDKASVEITSPFDGVIKEILVQEGEVAKVGSGLCLIEVEEEGTEQSNASESESARLPPLPTHEASNLSTPPASTPAPPEAQHNASKPRRKHPMDPEFSPEKDGASDANVLATPSVRHFARQNGVDLSKLVPGRGKDGRIERADVEAFLAGGNVDTQPSRASTPAASASSEADVVVELGRTRYGMWKAMVKSLEIPHFGYSTTLDITALNAMLPTLNASIPPHFLPPSPTPAPPPAVSPSALHPAPSPPPISPSAQYTRLTYLPILLKTLAKSMIEWPLFRASITPNQPDAPPTAKPTLTIRPHADISIALSTPHGLYTPTLQRADTHSVSGLASQLKHLAYLGRQTPCGLGPAEMPKRGGTITVSNVGAIGEGEFAAPVLVPGGGVAIVAIGRAKWVWDVNRGDGMGERRLKVGISWSADHRVVEGAELAAFVECWRGYVEKPERLIADSV